MTRTSQTQTTPESEANTAKFFDDLEAIRLSPEDTTGLGAKEILTRIPVRRPRKQEFVRCHPDLQTILAGASRLTFVPSLYDHLIELAIATHPTGQPPKKARQPSQRFVGRRRSPTPQELEGLKKGNEKRRLEAEARRTPREEGKATAKRPTLIDT
jgi:hypothetical protein